MVSSRLRQGLNSFCNPIVFNVILLAVGFTPIIGLAAFPVGHCYVKTLQRQSEAQKLGVIVQLEAQKYQSEAQKFGVTAELEAQLEAQKHQVEVKKLSIRAQLEAQLEAQKHELEVQKEKNNLLLAMKRKEEIVVEGFGAKK